MVKKNGNMPKALERYLKKEAMKHHLHGDRMNAYIYSTLNKIEKARKKKYGGKYA